MEKNASKLLANKESFSQSSSLSGLPISIFVMYMSTCFSSYIIVIPFTCIYFSSECVQKRSIHCSIVSTTIVGINKSHYIFALSQLTLKVKGQRRPVMLQKDPQDIYSLYLPHPQAIASFLPPFPVNAVVSIVHDH